MLYYSYSICSYTNRAVGHVVIRWKTKSVDHCELSELTHYRNSLAASDNVEMIAVGWLISLNQSKHFYITTVYSIILSQYSNEHKVDTHTKISTDILQTYRPTHIYHLTFCGDLLAAGGISYLCLFLLRPVRIVFSSLERLYLLPSPHTDLFLSLLMKLPVIPLDSLLQPSLLSLFCLSTSS